jgi:hypothetical protein
VTELHIVVCDIVVFMCILRFHSIPSITGIVLAHIPYRHRKETKEAYMFTAKSAFVPLAGVK